MMFDEGRALKKMKLAVENITIEIDKKIILNGVTHAFAEGRRTSIIGANGAGKSTLLKALCLLNEKFNGSITLDGRDVRSIGRRTLAQSIAILPQERDAPVDTTVRQLTSYGRFPHQKLFSGGNPKQDREAIAWAMSVTNVEHLANRQVSTLSGGERQRAWLAMSLAQQPKILLLDEPTTYLDISHQLEVMEIIADVNRRYNMTVIMVLHDINHAVEFSDEVIVINGGGIFARGAPSTVLNPTLIREVFNVDAEIFSNAPGDKILGCKLRRSETH